ncbi:MAG: hypothetical protein H6Q61_445 [Firmicutes bacterium]|nr:hypothetical protein [Bacillota bacterium]
MSERVMPGPVCDNTGIREAVCISTKKIYDSCRDRDCIENLRFYPTHSSQSVIDRALSIRSGKAELLNVHIDVEPTGFSRGFFTVDIRYFYRITAEAFVGAARPVEITGLAIFDKRVILFGGEGSAKIFSSQYVLDDIDEQSLRRTNMPTAVVEAVDPIVLSMKLVDPASDCCMPCPPPCCPPCCAATPFDVGGVSPCNSDSFDIPPNICSCFGSDLSFGNDRKRVYLTLGQFSIIRLERDSQLLIPVYDYCLPTKECTGTGGATEDDPCELFRQVQFPVDEFFPPSSTNGTDDTVNNCCCRRC